MVSYSLHNSFEAGGRQVKNASKSIKLHSLLLAGYLTGYKYPRIAPNCLLLFHRLLRYYYTKQHGIFIRFAFTQAPKTRTCAG
jgi:hypothetical protein